MTIHPKIYSGLRVGRLTVLERTGEVKSCHPVWMCSCDCGNKVDVRQGDLRSSQTKSCGCFRLECLKARKRHGETIGHKCTPEWTAWSQMKYRCTDPKNKRFKNYGSRGISVCDRWMSFENFLEDMGRKPENCDSIDRIDNNKGYSPENCRWATYQEQQNNRTSNRWIEFDGKRLTLAQWERELGFQQGLIALRLWRGWSEEKALTQKPRVSRR